ncbi:MAG: hypothetical protein IT381_09700 [Deltaproteobacteria bacterium]|nr:hypothetical protein [Deltaproteobacteria bacterium]
MATVAVDYDIVRRALTVRIEGVAPEGEDLALVSYVEALKDPYLPGDVDRLWDYPGPPEGARVVRFDCTPCAEGRRLGPGVFSATLEAILPRRYGGLGATKDQTLLTGLVPFVVEHASDPVRARPLLVEWTLGYAPLAHGAQWLEQPAHFDGDPSTFSLAVSLRGYVTLNGEPRAPVVRPAEPPRHSADLDAAPRSLPRWVVYGPNADERLLDAHAWIAAALARFGIPAQRWVVGALRREPAVCGGDVLIVSRELFRATPLTDIMDFQRYGLARRALACAAKRAHVLSSEDADAFSVWLTRVLLTEAKGKLVNPRDLLRPLSFIPDIDSLIYAPQMPWADVYFLAVDEPRTGPPTPDAFFHGRPRGKLFVEKLLDRVGDELFTILMHKAIERHVGISVVAEEELPHIWQAILEDFSGPYPAIDFTYKVDGQAVHVLRDGPGVAAREPITVRVQDADGKDHVQKALGIGTDEAVEFPEAKAPFKEVELDPDRRLVEYHLKPGEHPRFNNQSWHRLRVTLTRLSAALGFSALEVFAGADMSIRREYDLHHHFGFGADYDPSGFGLNARYSYGFGPRVTPDYLGYRVGTTLALDRLTQGFAGATDAVYLATMYAYLGYDDRPSDRTAMRGFAWQVYAAIGLPIGRPVFGYAGGSILKIFHLADAHAIALRLRFATTLGDAPDQAKYALGGRFNARGFPLGELTRNARLTASAEYRHELFRGFRSSLLDLVYLDGVEGAFFGDAVFLADNIPGLFRYENMFFDVGYGIRFLFDQLGVNPGVLAIDVGVPIKRYNSSLFPVSVYLDFVQSFAAL